MSEKELNEEEILEASQDEIAANSEDSNGEEIAKLEEKIAQLEDRYLRANAEFENFRKRLEKEKMQAISYAHEQFAKDLLPVIDTLEIALTSSKDSENSEKILEGISLTIDQFLKCFQKHGIEAISTDGEFDPNVHDAVMQVESEDHKNGEIVQVLQKGYTIKDRILRPSMVSIAK
ncbi:MAG: nucleotide exchange factor GrpE [Campylobacterales bacterium]|jgi:molecular chaperone GrpE|nr:nucleotide exchange factor GrpE [Campylobacterales bacterium]NLM98862.1 nucleotide exchange factor GrpE [Campylobacteraceae bacterium]